MRNLIFKISIVAALFSVAFASQQASAATTIRYDFEFTINYSNDVKYQVGTNGTGFFTFEEQTVEQGVGGWPGVNTNYTTRPFALEIEQNNLKTILINSGGFIWNEYNNWGVIVQDIPANQLTYDLFRVAGENSRLSIFAPATTIDNYALTAANVDKMWDNRVLVPTVGGSIEIVNGYVHARLTSLNRISTAPAVPEPTVWVMMVLGLGAIGASMRRRHWVGNDARKPNTLQFH